MKNPSIVRLMALSGFLIALSSQALGAVGDVVQSFPSPGTWPEGLAWDGTNLWNADGYGQRIYKLNPDNGAIITSYASPGTFPEGLVFAQGYLYNCDWDTGLIYKLEVTPTTLNIVETITGPGARAIGLTFDGRALWHAAWEQHLFKLRLEDGSIDREYITPDPHPEDLAWDGANLWLTDWYAGRIYKINPATGDVLLSFPSPGNRSVGLTFDGRYLWNSDTSGYIYKIDVGSTEIPSLRSMGAVVTTVAITILMGISPVEVKNIIDRTSRKSESRKGGAQP